MSKPATPLPPGQKEIKDFARFGLYQFAFRIQEAALLEIRVSVPGKAPLKLGAGDLAQLARHEQINDFHCVTSWSVRNVKWSGYRFREFFEAIIQPRLQPGPECQWVIFRARDGYRTYLLLEDLLAGDVLLADRVNDGPVGWEHGTPLRLVAPAHYGYKSAKHVCAIEFQADLSGFKPNALHWHEHPRARVALEERGRFLPNPVQRFLNKAVVPSVKCLFRIAAGRRGSRK